MNFLTIDVFLVLFIGMGPVKALLVYLAVEADRPHRREALAGLLWPWTDSSHRPPLWNSRRTTSW